MENDPIKRQPLGIVTDAVNLTDAEFCNFLALIAAHKVIRELAPELVDRGVDELSRLPRFRHNLN